MSHPLRLAIEKVGLCELARHLGISYQAIRKWLAAGRMPRTEWTGETDYCKAIEQLTAMSVTRDALLAPWPSEADEVHAGPVTA